MHNVLSLGEELKANCIKQMRNKEATLEKLKDMRPRILEQVSRYIDEIENEIIAASNSYDQILEKEVSCLDEKI